MSSTNIVVCVGNLTRDPQVRYVGDNNTAIAEVGMALNEKRGKNETVSFVDLVFWGKSAEIMGEYATKGKKMAINGRLKQEQWENKDGEKRSKLVIVVEDFEFLSGGQQAKQKDASLEDEAPF